MDAVPACNKQQKLTSQRILDLFHLGFAWIVLFGRRQSHPGIVHFHTTCRIESDRISTDQKSHRIPDL